ncbi:hypothetical protein SUGI_0194950 [Cryptomeria japonica]|nr:hypothetical protein SUGI_0194950 [Cryptomeria japonica]
MFSSTQAPTALRIFGARSILVADEEEVHKRLRGAVMPFLKSESLKSLVGRMDLKEGGEKDLLSREFETLLNGSLSLPLDFAATTFRKALNARSRICRLLVGIMERRKVQIAQGRASPEQDLLSCLVCMRDENGQPLTEEEITDNLIVVLTAGHDTTCALLTHIVRMLALHPEVYHNVLQGFFVGVFVRVV